MARQSPPPQRELVLSIPDDDLRIGRFNETDRLERIFRVTNVSRRPVTLERFDTTCECVDVTPNTKVRLEPGETSAFRVSLAARELQNATGVGPVPFAIGLRLRHTPEGAATEVAAWQFTGEVVPAIYVAPTQLNFGLHSELDVPIGLSFAVELGPDTTDIRVETPSGWIANVERTAVKSDARSYKVTLQESVPLTPRVINALVHIVPSDATGRPLATKSIKLTGEIATDVLAEPRTIMLGRRHCGETIEEFVALRSLTGRSFTARSVSSDGSGVSIAATPTANVFAVGIAVSNAGEHSTVAGFAVRVESGREVVVEVPVRYFGAKQK